MDFWKEASQPTLLFALKSLPDDSYLFSWLCLSLTVGMCLMSPLPPTACGVTINRLETWNMSWVYGRGSQSVAPRSAAICNHPTYLLQWQIDPGSTPPTHRSHLGDGGGGGGGFKNNEAIQHISLFISFSLSSHLPLSSSFVCLYTINSK